MTQEEFTEEVPASRLAGTWYPGGAKPLGEAVDRFLAEAKVLAEQSLRAMVVPHAGYSYSGRAAGAGYAHLQRGVFRRVVLLAPSHFHHFQGGAIFPGRGFETPLGVVEIDREAVRRLIASPAFFLAAEPYRREHSLEIQLPFLQRIDPQLRIVPILVGGEGQALGTLASGLRSLDDGESVFLVSSDFTHYGASFDYLPFPPSGAGEVGEHLRELDLAAIDLVCRLDADGFEAFVRDTGATICGRAPILAFLRASHTITGTLASYYTSLDVTGDYEHSVSYAAIVFSPSHA